MKYISRIIILIILTGFCAPLLASEEEDALSIMRKMEEMNQTDSSKTEISMIIYPDVYR